MFNWIRFRLARRARRIHAEALLKIPNVCLVYTGTKIKAGVDTGKPAVVVGVERKLKAVALQQLKIPLVPAKIGRVSTDVIETRRLKAPPQTGVKRIKSPSEHQAKFRPKVPGGVSAIEWCSSACTTTCWVWSKSLGEPVLHQNFHCARLRGCKDGYITQPSPYDAGVPPRDNIAQFIAGDISNETTDSAISRALDTSYATKEIFKLGRYKGYGVPKIGDKVIKSGRTSGVTTGTIQGIDGVADIDYGDYGIIRKSDLIVTTKMLDGGDSSSPLKRVGSDGNPEPPLMGQGFAGSDLASAFIKIPNVISDPALAHYALDFEYEWENGDGNGGGDGNVPTCEEQDIACTQEAMKKPDFLSMLIAAIGCAIAYFICKLGAARVKMLIGKSLGKKTSKTLALMNDTLGVQVSITLRRTVTAKKRRR